MSSDGKIYIYITNKEPNSGEGDSGEAEGSNKSLGNYIAHKSYDFVKDQAKKAITYQINNIGNFTGDYIAQRQATESLQVLSTAISIGTAFAVNPVVGIIATAGSVISSLYERHSGLIENAKTNYNIEQLRKRAGLSSLEDGNRTGD